MNTKKDSDSTNDQKLGFEEFSKLFNQKVKSKVCFGNNLPLSNKISNADDASRKQSATISLVDRKNTEGELISNNRVRSKKRSEQMKKRLDKVSGDNFVFKEENNKQNDINLNIVDDEIIGSYEFPSNDIDQLLNMEEDKVEINDVDKENQNLIQHKYAKSLHTYQNKRKHFSFHRNTNSIIGFNKDDGTVVEANDINNSLNQLEVKEEVEKNQALNKSNGAANDEVINDTLNVSNFNDSIIENNVENDQLIKPLSESQQIILNNHILHGQNNSFIPLKNNLNLISLHNPSNITESYQLALSGGIDLNNPNENKNITDEIIEEEESFQESEIPTPKNHRYTSSLPYSIHVKAVSSGDLRKSFLNNKSNSRHSHTKTDSFNNNLQYKINNLNSKSIDLTVVDKHKENLEKENLIYLHTNVQNTSSQLQQKKITPSIKDMKSTSNSNNQNNLKKPIINCNNTHITQNTQNNQSKQHEQFRKKVLHSKSDGKQFSNLFFNNTVSQKIMDAFASKSKANEISNKIKISPSHKNEDKKSTKAENFKYIHNLAISIDQFDLNKEKDKKDNLNTVMKSMKNMNISSGKSNTPKTIQKNNFLNTHTSDFDLKQSSLKSSLTLKYINKKKPSNNNVSEFIKTQPSQVNKKTIKRNNEAISIPNSTKSLTHIKNISALGEFLTNCSVNATNSSVIPLKGIKSSKTKAVLTTNKDLLNKYFPNKKNNYSSQNLIDINKKINFSSTMTKNIKNKKTIDVISESHSKMSAFSSNKSMLKMNQSTESKKIEIKKINVSNDAKHFIIKTLHSKTNSHEIISDKNTTDYVNLNSINNLSEGVSESSVVFRDGDLKKKPNFLNDFKNLLKHFNLQEKRPLTNKDKTKNKGGNQIQRRKNSVKVKNQHAEIQEENLKIRNINSNKSNNKKISNF